MYYIILNIFKREKLVDTAINGCDYRKCFLLLFFFGFAALYFSLRFLMLCDMLNCIDALFYNQISVYIRIVKDEILG